MWGALWRILAAITCVIAIAGWLESRPWLPPEVREIFRLDLVTAQVLITVSVVAFIVCWALQLEKQAERRKSVSYLREFGLARLARARTASEDLWRQGESATAAREWQKGYTVALEEVLSTEGVSLRRHPRRPTAIPTEIEQISPAAGALGRSGGGTIVDLSAGGCRLTTRMELLVGEIIWLSFALPESSAPTRLDARVRRTQRVGEELEAGVEFRRVPKALRKGLAA